MTQYEIYIFILCLIVFVLLTALSIICITLLTKMYLKLVRAGLEDDNLIKDTPANFTMMPTLVGPIIYNGQTSMATWKA